MHKNDKNKYKNMTIENLNLEINSIRNDIFLFKIKKFTNNFKNFKFIGSLRRNLARLLTFLNNKRKETNNE